MIAEPDHLILMDVGPIHRLEARSGLAPPGSLGVGRWLLALLAWLPQPVLIALAGGAERNSLLKLWAGDFTNHARLLLAIPLLLAGEHFVEARVTIASRRFGAELVEPADQAYFHSLIARLNNLADSNLVEVVLVLAAYLLVLLRIVTGFQVHEDWFSTSAHAHLTAAGVWTAAVGLPLFIFLVLRWLWRYGLWVAFLWRMSRLRLHLVTTHPDRTGGLGFLAATQLPFGTLPFVISAIIASTWAKEVHWYGADLMTKKAAAVLLLVAVLLIFVLPLVMFAPLLWRLRITGVERYYNFSTSLGRAFDQKWLPPSTSESALSSDASFLTDAGSAHDRVYRVRPVPFGYRLIAYYVVFTAAPMLFPLSMSFPIWELAKKLMKALA
jgi:hypothetical protein